MDELYTYDYLPGTNLYLYQRTDMFRCNSDTALLGHFMKIRKSDRVLDIGTNNGALLLYASRFSPRYMMGVDINEEACALALRNLHEHKLDDVEIKHGNILDMKLELFSCIICNPPYFKVEDPSKLNQNTHLSQARHEVHLQLEPLIKKVKVLLEDRGRLYLVHRADRFIDIACLMRTYGLEIKSAQFIYDEDKEDARSVLIEAMKNGRPQCRILMPHVIKR